MKLIGVAAFLAATANADWTVQTWDSCGGTIPAGQANEGTLRTCDSEDDCHADPDCVSPKDSTSLTDLWDVSCTKFCSNRWYKGKYWTPQASDWTNEKFKN